MAFNPFKIPALQAVAGRGAMKARVGLKVAKDTPRRLSNVLQSVSSDRSYVKAGLLGPKATTARKAPPGSPVSQKQPNNVELGIIHEYGTRTIPARPFIGPAFARNRKEYIRLLGKLVRASVYSGNMTYLRALGIVGAKMAADMKKYVTAGPQIPPPNAPKTLERKIARGQWKRRKKLADGDAPPPRTLVDTGRMVGAITWGVVPRSSGDIRRGRKGRK